MAAFISQNNVVLLTAYLVISSIVLMSSANRPPKISVGLPYSGKAGVLPLPEDTPLNSYLAIMETKDEDIGPDGEVDCVTDNPYISIPLVYPKTYKVELAKELDRETVNFVKVSIMCSDKGVPPLTSTAVFTIEIIDINDNAPTFVKKGYNVSVTENVPIGTLVTRVKATDPDAEHNAAVQYSLHDEKGSNISHFTIDKESGKIFTNVLIDREVKDHYVLTVVAKDSGLPSQSSSVQVRIQVEDVNDNAPIIITKELHIQENQKPMSVLGTLQASDPDIGKNSEMVFSKVEVSEASSTAPFLVQPSGEILSVVSLDREQKQLYTMEVTVRDKGSPRLNNTAIINIYVDDVNDNTPIVDSACLYEHTFNEYDDLPNDDPAYSYEIASNVSGGFISINWYTPEEERLIYKVDAVDKDSDDNGRLRYAIESVISGDARNSSTNNDPLFQIDYSTGEITLRRYLQKGDDLIQILNISVSDNGNPPLAAFCLLNITIDVDVSTLTTPKTTGIKSKSSMNNEPPGNAAPNIFITLTFSPTNHLSVFVLSLSLCLNSLLYI